MSKSRKRIPVRDSPADKDRLQFSFRYLDEVHSKFRLQDCSQEFFVALLRKIREYSEYTEAAFTEGNNAANRHRNFWPDTSEPDGFLKIPIQLASEYGWQFALDNPKVRHGSSDKWRVHGMLADSVFYVIWLDPLHQLCAKKARNTSKN